MAKVMFPLADNYFRPLELSPREAEQYRTWAASLLQETIDGYHRDQFETQEQKERKWKVLKQRGGLTAFRRRKGTEAEGDEFRYLCTGKIDGSLDEVLLGRYADTTDAFRRLSAVYREDLVDCAVLHVLDKASPDRPFFFSGFKWMTVKSPGKGLVKNRDVCWFEQMGITRDRNGKEVGYSIAESVDIATCPPFDSSICVRARLSVCYLFKRNKSGGTKVYMRGKNNAGGKVLDWVADLKSAELWLRVERALACAHAYIGSEMVRAARPRDAANILVGTHSRCEVCGDKIAGMMASQKDCSVCHRVTCSRCVVKRRVLSSARDFLYVERETFCKRCMRFFLDVNCRDRECMAAMCETAAARGDPQALSSYAHKQSHSSQASSEGLREDWTNSAGSVSSFALTTPHPAPIPANNGAASCPAPPVVLYPEVAPPARSVSSEPAGTKLRGFTPVAPGSHSSFASEISFADSTDSGEALSFRDTTDSSPDQAFREHLVGSVSSAATSYGSTRAGYTTESVSSTSSFSTPEDMMAQMIRMNIMAEQARQMVKENDKFTRQVTYN